MKRSRSSHRRLACIAGALFALTSCGTEPTEDASVAPVFALDRDAATEILPLADDRGEVLPVTDLRLVLQALLTEHATLSNEAMRRAIDGGDAGPTLTALTANTDGLTSAIGLVYGPAGANAFDQLWTNHIEFFNRYAAAIRSGDEAEAVAVLLELDHYETDFSDFVDVATGGELEFHDVLHVLHSHVEQLLDQAEAWNDGDHALAFELGTEAFDHMDGIALALADAIARQSPEAFPGSLDDEGHAACAAARLDLTHRVTTEADLALAGVDARTAAMLENERAEEAVVALGLDQATLVSIQAQLDTVESASDVPAARAEALASVAVLPIAACD